jgi:hypothetical protein
VTITSVSASQQESAVKNDRKRVDCDGTSSPTTTAGRVASLDA